MTEYGENTGLEKVNITSKDLTQDNINKIGHLFPNVLTEARDENGNLRQSIDFDKLRDILSHDIVEGNETYEFSWVGKRDAMAEAGCPTTKTLRPDLEESVDFENTENVFITGDNLEVLKILQESYLNKIDMIYIDPPYNTGNDFVYNDKFTIEQDEYDEQVSARDENNQRLIKNEKSNARYHSDWLNMIYPRLVLARNLLKDTGVIFISIDENESSNLKNLADEVFGEVNYVGDIIRKTRSAVNDSKTGFNQQHEYLLVYANNIERIFLKGEPKDFLDYSNPDNDPNGDWKTTDPSARSGGVNSSFPIENPFTKKIDFPPVGRYWAFSKETFEKWVKKGKIVFRKEYADGQRGFIVKKYRFEIKSQYNTVNSLFGTDNIYMNQNATRYLRDTLFEGTDLFTSPKQIEFIKKVLQYGVSDNATILDFFAGSATTADAVMQLNAEDGGNRKYILCTLDEETAEQSTAREAGYQTIDQISRERIRRASSKLLKENPELIDKVDFGFKAFKVDSSNYQDVLLNPTETTQQNLFSSVSNIKEERTDLDLLFQIMIRLGLELSLPIKKVIVEGSTMYNVSDDALIACFDDHITEQVIRKIAQQEPLRAVFKDSSFERSADKINLEQIFKEISPNTKVRVI